MEIYCRVTPMGFVPLDEGDWEKKQTLRVGTDVKVVVERPRNLAFHRKFFALLQLVKDNLPEAVQQATGIESVEALLAAVKIDLGHFDVETVNGHQYLKLRSISFAKMSEQDFSKFYDLAVTDILRKYLRGTDRQTLDEEVRRFAGF